MNPASIEVIKVTELNAFLSLCHTDLTNDLQQITNFLNVANYPKDDGILQVEFGSIQNFRFMVSSIGSVLRNASANNADVYNIFNVGMEAVCAIDQDFEKHVLNKSLVIDLEAEA